MFTGIPKGHLVQCQEETELNKGIIFTVTYTASWTLKLDHSSSDKTLTDLSSLSDRQRIDAADQTVIWEKGEERVGPTGGGGGRQG